jgi:hypothetical protein
MRFYSENANRPCGPTLRHEDAVGWNQVGNDQAMVKCDYLQGGNTA